MGPEPADTQMDRNFIDELAHYRALPARISRAAWFEAAHHLAECNDTQGYKRLHGHSFKIELILEGVPSGPNGWVEDLGAVEAALEDLRKTLDHAYLNEIDGLEVPSLERLCAWIAAKMAPRFTTLKAVCVSRPSLKETCQLDVRQPKS